MLQEVFRISEIPYQSQVLLGFCYHRLTSSRHDRD